MVDENFFYNAGPYSLEQLSSIGTCTLSSPDFAKKIIKSVASLNHATEDDITFLNNTKYLSTLENSKAGACIIAEKYINYAPKNMPLLITNAPYVAYAKIAASFFPETENNHSKFIGQTAAIAKSAIIGDNCYIAEGVVIGDKVIIGNNTKIFANTTIAANVKIGDNCEIHSNCSITHSIIGNNVIIKPGARIGYAGFGFATDKGMHIKVPQLGRVLIGNNVNIGANTCIDRGSGPDTIIKDWCKIDNLVQIGHNVELGIGCIVVSQVGISGSTKCGNYVVIGGQVGIAGHLNIGDLVNIAAQSGVMTDIEPKQIVGGSPSLPIKQWHRQNIILKNMTNKNDKKDSL